MNALAWNARGFGNLLSFMITQDLIRRKLPNLAFLIETRLHVGECEELRVNLGFNSAFKVPSKGKGVVPMVLWNNDLKVSIRSFNVGHVNMMVDTEH